MTTEITEKQPIIRIKNLNKSFGAQKVLQGIHLG